MNFEKKRVMKGLKATRDILMRIKMEHRLYFDMELDRRKGKEIDIEKYMYVGYKLGEDVQVALSLFDKTIGDKTSDKYIGILAKYRHDIKRAVTQAGYLQLSMDTKLIEYSETGKTSATEMQNFSLDMDEIESFYIRLDDYIETGECPE